MKKLTVFLSLLLVLITACNHEAPTIASLSQFDIVTKVRQNPDNPSWIDYTIYLPATQEWCGERPTGTMSPFILAFYDGERHEKFLEQWEIQNPEPGFEDYYAYRFTLGKGEVKNVLMTYGVNGIKNNPKSCQKAILSNKKNDYIIQYRPTSNRADDEYLIGFTISEGQFRPINSNLLIPMKAGISMSGQARVGQAVRFWPESLEYTQVVGLEPISWEFGGSYFKTGFEVWQSFNEAGGNNASLILTDNLGNTVKISKDFTVY